MRESYFIDEIVFVVGLPDDNELLAALARADSAVREIHVLDPARDGLAQMAQILSGREEIAAIHIVSHASSGRLEFGASFLNEASLSGRQAELDVLGGALGADGDLLLYGCNLAAGESGTSFLRALAEAVGADVAASVDLTGSSAFGGDWVLEAAAGSIEATPLVAPDFGSVLAAATPTTNGLGTQSIVPAGDPHIDIFIDPMFGYKWGNGGAGSGIAITYSIPQAGAVWAVGGAYNFQGPDAYEPGSIVYLTSEEAGYAVQALQAWADVANIVLTAVTETSSVVGDIRIAYSGIVSGSTLGWAWYPSYLGLPAAGDVWLNPSPSGVHGSDFMPGRQGFELLVHELGHAFGMDHPNKDPNDPAYTSKTTVMSYNDRPDNYYWSNADNDFRFVYYDTPSLYDVAAMQYIYGVNPNAHAGDTTYLFEVDQPFFRTLWDSGGNDTISVANFTTGCTINLNAGAYSSIRVITDPLPAGYSGSMPTYHGDENLAIAFGCAIENATGGSGADVLIGNSLANVLVGGGGVDIAIFTGNKVGYSIVKNGNGTYTVTDTHSADGDDGADTLSGIEKLQFLDGTTSLGKTLGRDYGADGKADILWQNGSNGAVYTFEMNGTAIQSQGFVTLSGPAGWQVIETRADFGGDGKSDILWWNGTTKSAYLYQMSGATIQSEGFVTQNVPAGWDIVETKGDFNGDGKADILWKNAANATYIYLMDGTTITAQGYERTGIGAGWEIAEAEGDYNGDGKSDILWQNTNTGALYIDQMNGTSIQSEGFVIPSGPAGWQVIEAKADFGGDGKSDILWWNAATHSAYLYQMNGMAIQSDGFVVQGVPAGWDIVGTRGDYNGDGKADIFWKNAANATYIYLMNGNAVTGEGYERTGIGAGWAIADSEGDYGGDGKSDILWKNSISGDVYLDQVNGTAIQSEGFVAFGVPAGWEVSG